MSRCSVADVKSDLSGFSPTRRAEIKLIKVRAKESRFRSEFKGYPLI